ncbi:hypothetical protein MBM09_08980 [Flaviramulus sp. BrNp1-15]|uniref:hypothetical protein n=1 Tax=Flaviramulus sp. BrNp1-15 TaxID=2916754 RepID=UPI001EE8CBB5|nr:hypothetical protein [Flaviramulus sp. BrNp1-15]ULC58053.1 hypothetical protein MBM09_08980 [Flaviramulus sp. BrNp1-15]
MKGEILIDNVSFWVDKKIIYCKVCSDFNESFVESNMEEIFLYAISELSKDVYMPIIINMKELSYALKIRLFKILSRNRLIKEKVLSKTFLVDSFLSKLILSIHNIANDPVVPNTIFKDKKSAVKHCNKLNMVFNVFI